ncbi:hypothetical protein VM1G_10655 [Cytospora mali]|uniref:Fungal N-terminal domain-containing protein n=1 Tax=Cytospora mali TaxID=578113 RepID=A0A194VIW4_CYTMA|nr:hypothetical protein VM1G_10655 [Valsa mali]
MDPLSITVSAVSLIQVVASVTKTLRGFKHSIKNIDARIDELCGELDRLTTCLKTVQETLEKCQQLDLASVGEVLWQQCDVAISDCNMTLIAMSIMAEKVKGTEKSRGFMWRTKAVVNWSEHSADLTAFRDKIHKSHLALQTMLQTITVSASLRSHDSIELVHLKLDVLKKSIEDAFGAAMRPAGGFSYNESDLRLTHNLRKLLDAAKQFHSAASSTASTIRDGTINGPWTAHGDQAISLMGDFPPTRRKWVEEYVRAGRHRRYQSPDSPGEQTPPRAVSPRRRQSSPGSPSAASSIVIDNVTAKILAEVDPEEKNAEENTGKEEEDDDDDDDAEAKAEAERAFQDKLQELALDRVNVHDYNNAIEFLLKALKPEPSTDPAKAERRQLQIQLAVCYLLIGDWKQAEVIVSALSKTKSDRDSVICTLLHALSLAHLFDYSFELALSVGQQALQGRKRLLKAGSIDSGEVDETRALLATIYDVRGGNDDYIRADVLTGQLSKSFEYKHPTNEMEFIKSHPTLLSTVFGDGHPDIPIVLTTHVELPGDAVPSIPRIGLMAVHEPTRALRSSPTVAVGVSPLVTKLTDHWRYEQDTAKVAISSPTPAPRPLSLDTTSIGDAEPITVDTPDGYTSTNIGTPTSIDTSIDIETPNSPAKHRLAQLLTSKLPGLRRPEDTLDAAESPITNLSPTSRWLRCGGAFGLAKPKKFLRKKPDEYVPKRQKRPMNFRFPSLKRIHREDVADPDENDTRIKDWLGSQPCEENNEDYISVVARVGSSRESLCGPTKEQHSSPASLPCRSTSPSTPYDEATAFAQYMKIDMFNYPYMPESIVVPVETDGNAYHELMDTGLVQPLIVPISKEVSCSSSINARLDGNHQEPDPARDPPTSSPSRTRPKLTLQPIQSTLTIGFVLGQIAGLFAALHEMTDENKRYETKLTLSRLLPYATISHDPVLAHDIRRAIETLEKDERFESDDSAFSDSGYETTSPDRMDPTMSASGSSDEAEAEAEHDDPVSASPTSSKPRLKTGHKRRAMEGPTSPGLKRAFSFVVGSEDNISWRRPRPTHLNDKEDSAWSPRKQVSFAPDPDSLGDFESDGDGRREIDETTVKKKGCTM